MKSPSYVLIAGHGRSGTNWLLEILDQSPRTHCRNEPNECAESAFFKLPSGRLSRPDLDAELELAWDEAVAQASRSFGARDQKIVVPKDHFLRLAQRLGLVRLARAKRPRPILGRVLSAHPREEWPIPSWVADPRRRDRSLPVHKLNTEPGWIVWALRNRPEAHVIQIVRHPGGYLNSLMKRLWSQLDPAEVVRDNLELLMRIAEADPAWASRFGDLAALSTVETELWYWRYATEMVHLAGEGNPRYQLVKYEELTSDPVEISRSIYRGCGLEWDHEIERAVRQTSGESQAIAAAWERKLSAEQIAMVKRALDDSIMRDWWDEPQRPVPDPAAAAGAFDGVPSGGHPARLGPRS